MVSGSWHLITLDRVLFFDFVYLFDLIYTFCMWFLLREKNFLWFPLHVPFDHFIWCLPHPELCETSNNCFPFNFSLAFRILYSSLISVACSAESFPDWTVLVYLISSYLLVIPFILLCTVFLYPVWYVATITPRSVKDFFCLALYSFFIIISLSTLIAFWPLRSTELIKSENYL